MLSGRRKVVLVVILVLVAGALLYQGRGVLSHSKLSGQELLKAMRGARISLLLLSVALIYCCYALRALRWMRFSQHIGPASFWNIYGMTLAGFSVLFLLGRAADPIRPLLLARKERQPVADTFGIYALERLFDTASTAVIAAIGLLLLRVPDDASEVTRDLQRAARSVGVGLCAGVLAVVVVLVYLRLHGSALLERRLESARALHGLRGSIARIVLGFLRGVQTIKSWGDLFAAVFFSAAHWGLIALIYALVSQSFGGQLASIGLSQATLVMAFSIVGSTVQLPAIGGGSQAGSFLAYTAIFGVEKEPALVAAIVLWLITFASCTLTGVPLLIREGVSLGDLRRMTHQPQVSPDEAGGGRSGA
ncbi:MAG TPA: lysylphosphatidylglycerol synthase transmembrane domain-containing protein [Methylomirabilota bacterium]|nr:lysylphosphatidylglycerol synthase transmembrane domain-containing protein [Methylomirabilota bacterium]